jgi:ABC-type glycerol-3-phosphate transport system substrate-binding protein
MRGTLNAEKNTENQYAALTPSPGTPGEGWGGGVSVPITSGFTVQRCGFTKPLLIMALLACVGFIGIWFNQPAAKTDMNIWLFARMHKKILCDGNPSLVEQYRQATGQSVGVEQMVIQAEDVRLLSMFMSQSRGVDVPDAVEVEINSVGEYFRSPLDQVGFYPLNQLVAELPPEQKLLASRFAPWSKDGVIFGIPHDVCPVAIIYRHDLFEDAGINLPSAKTWDEFQRLCLKAQAYWSAHGHPEYHAMELRRSRADHLLMMMMQRHLNPLDDHNRVQIADAKVAQTLAFYAGLSAGPGAIGAEPPAADMMWTRSLASGEICASFCPDWRIAELKSYAPELAGKVSLMPLPIFEPGDAPTATWGGTMTAIPRAAKNPAASWRMIQFLYLSPQAIKARQQYTDILPANPTAWNDPGYHLSDPFFGGQKVNELYIELARQLPERYVTPFTVLAEQQLANVLIQAIERMRTQGSAGLQEQCQHWLNAEAIDLQRRVNFGKFEQ